MGRGGKSFIHKSRKERKEKSDFNDLVDFQVHLENMGYEVSIEPLLSCGSFKSKTGKRKPDLHVVKYPFKKRPNVYFDCLVELDGEYHGDMDEATESEQTLNRNTDYELGHYHYIIINKQVAKEFNLKLDDLLAYRVMEEESKFRARLNAGSFHL